MLDIEARREARRRKILANADKRLKKITSVQSNEVPGEDHGEHNDNTEAIGELIEDNIPEDPTDVELTQLFQNRNFPTPNEANITKKSDKKTTQVIVLVGLAIFTRLLQLLVSFFASDSDTQVANKVFAPFFLYEFMEVFVIKTEIPAVGLINFLMFFGNIPPNFSRRIIEVFNLFTKIAQDALVFFFVYVMVDLVIGNFVE